MVDCNNCDNWDKDCSKCVKDEEPKSVNWIKGGNCNHYEDEKEKLRSLT